MNTYEVDTLIFTFLYQSVMSLNGPSIVSARSAWQPCVSVLVVQGVQELFMILRKY